MENKTAERLKNKIPEIMDTWERIALKKIKAANFQETLALRNSLPVYLTQLADALSETIDRTSARKKFDKEASTRIGQKHGRERAASLSYTMDQMIFEYHILRQVVVDVLEQDEVLTDGQREVIVCSIEQAVNDAATEFSDTLRDFQEQLSQTLAHDLRSPITAAKLNAEMILRNPEAPSFYIDRAKKITQNLSRVDLMISDLLDVSRLRAGQRLSLEFVDFDLEEIINEVSEEFNIETQRLVIKSDGPCIGHWNKDGLRRMVENLANNAIKYGDEKKLVTISLSQTRTHTTIEVHNEGNPIPSEEQPTIFQSYRRGKATEKKVGWGLGLTMVKGMVESHQGTIKLNSDEKNGTSFIVEIPNLPQMSIKGQENTMIEKLS